VKRDYLYKLENFLLKLFFKYRKSGEWLKGVSPDLVRAKIYLLINAFISSNIFFSDLANETLV
jgi:hypothetical protein